MSSGRKSSQLFMVDDEDHGTKFTGSFSRKQKMIAIVIAIVIAVILLIVGIILIAQSNQECSKADGNSGASTGDGGTTLTTPTPSPGIDRCSYSDEAKKIDLDGLLKELQDTYYKAFPNDIAYHPTSTTDDVRKEFRVYNHTPAAIKARTDMAIGLLDKINKIKIDSNLLKPREHKALLQMKHYLKFVFGMPFEGNYYGGDWMLGPNSFCWQPMCSISYDIGYGIGNQPPRNRSELIHVLIQLQNINDTIFQYIDNMKLGVKTGMVRTVVECQGGLDAIRKQFEDVESVNYTAFLKLSLMKKVIDAPFFIYLENDVTQKWKDENGMFPNETIKAALIEHVAKPIQSMLMYLEFDHALHCRPDNIGPGGLSGLPINVIYYNGTAKPNSTTTKTLPIMENGVYPKINGSESYKKILGYFTTKDSTPDEVHALGWKQLGVLYPQVIEIAKTVTKQLNESQAISEFQKILVDNKVSFFNKKPLPENETTGDAFTKCKDEEGAKKYCPNRWAAMQDWFTYSRSVMSLLDPKTVKLFYFTGDMHTTPNCPVKLKADFNPSSAAQSYNDAGTKCTRTAYYNFPFFLRNLGPVYSEYSVNAHEARPGHHTQVQGNAEHFKDACGGIPAWLDGQTYYTAFTEGWALYAENPLIAKDTDTYKHNLMQKYGMLKWQVWRALRLIVDTGLHYKGFSRQKALDLFAEYAWDKTDLAEKEVLRYQSNPGQATAYMVGQVDIIGFRNYTAGKLGDKFSLKEFHYQTLAQGSSPLSFLESHTHKFVDCKLNPKKEGCSIILEPPSSSDVQKTTAKRNIFAEPIKPSHKHYI